MIRFLLPALALMSGIGPAGAQTPSEQVTIDAHDAPRRSDVLV
ncbi:hypothetical protein [Sphingomonas sp.]